MHCAAKENKSPQAWVSFQLEAQEFIEVNRKHKAHTWQWAEKFARTKRTLASETAQWLLLVS